MYLYPTEAMHQSKKLGAYGSYTPVVKPYMDNQGHAHHKITLKIEAIHTIKLQVQQNLK